MQNSKVKILSCILTCTIVLTLLSGVGSVTASAEVLPPYRYDDDQLGQNISDYMEDFLIAWVDDFFDSRLQNPQTSDTIVFVDYQLFNYGFLDHILHALRSRYDVESFDDIYQHTGISFFIHYEGYAFFDLETWVTTESLVGYDFSNSADCELLYNSIGEINMCFLGVWQFDSSLYSFTKNLQDQWEGDLPVYCIYRDPIVLSPDGLMFLYLNSLSGCFGNCYDAPGATYQ